MRTDKIIADFTLFLDDFKDRSAGYSIIDNFIRKSISDSDRLKSDLNSGDFTSLHRLAHSLKGGAMNIGAEIMSEKALDLEKRIKDNTYYENGINETEKEALNSQIEELKMSIIELKDFFSSTDKS